MSQPIDAQEVLRRRLRVCMFWCGGSSYISAGVRHLQMDPRLAVSLRVQLDNRGYDSAIFRGVQDVEALPAELLHDVDRQVQMVLDTQPDVLVVSGWMMPAYHKLLGHPHLRDTRFVMVIDNPWRGTIRQRITSLVRRRYLRRMSLVVAAGERSRVFARQAGVPDSRIRLGCYCFDYDAFSAAAAARRHSASWPRRFLFVGRLVEAKGIDCLVEGYRRYRRSVEDAWTLSTCGKGPLGHLLQGEPGIDMIGFVQPASLPGVLAKHGALLLPSRHEPWGVAIAEACAAGLPVACSDRCGAGLDLVRDYSNGIIFAANDPVGISNAMRYFHANQESLPSMGEISMALALPYSAHHWARRWAEYLLTAHANP